MVDRNLPDSVRNNLFANHFSVNRLEELDEWNNSDSEIRQYFLKFET